jgi:Fanconi anemia group M protein
MKIKNFTPRLYQQAILNTCLQKNCLIILPTGLGKTKTAIMITIHRLNMFPNSKALFLTPTKPLAEQIKNEFLESTDIEKVVVFTGLIKPEEREKLWNNAKIIVATPQTISNDIINNRIRLEEVSLFCIDEAHRSIGDYDSVWVSKQYFNKARFPRIIGLTASPGSDLKTINKVCNNLFIEAIEVRTEEDKDVKPYIQELETKYLEVELPKNFEKIKNYLENSFKSKLNKLKILGIVKTKSELTTKKHLLSLQKNIQSRISQGEKNIILWQGVSFIAEAIKVQHALELLETQGIKSAYKYMKEIYSTAEKTKVKATKNLAKDIEFKSAFILVEKLHENNENHPKINKLKEIIKKEIENNEKIKIIVFNQYRDPADNLVKELNKITNIKAKLFVGQTKKGETGLTQKKQIEILEDFKKRKYNCIVSTSIGEEGLDIPKVDLVIFYEPIPSAIRTIQRTGRTARTEKGKVIVLVTKKTRDEAYRWTSFHKQKKMHKILEKLKTKLQFEKIYQPTLNDFKQKNKIEIIADSREKGTGILKELVNLGIDVETKNLHSADYVINNIGIELKTKEDFLESIIDKRLLNQLIELKNNFEKQLIIIQGIEDIYSLRRIHPNAIRGMLATIALSYNIPIIYTKNPQDTAALLLTIAKREQDTDKKDFAIRQEKKPLTLKEQQEYIIESLPGVGPLLAKSLLKKFKSVKKIINAKEDKLQKVEKIGKTKAREIRKVIEEEYKNQ